MPVSGVHQGVPPIPPGVYDDDCASDGRPPAAGGAGVPVMAKGQVRSNKETRKPKAEKPKPAVSVGSSPFTTPPGKK